MHDMAETLFIPCLPPNRLEDEVGDRRRSPVANNPNIYVAHIHSPSMGGEKEKREGGGGFWAASE